MTSSFESVEVPTNLFTDSIEERLRIGERFAGLLALPLQEGLHLMAITSTYGLFHVVDCDLETPQITYPLLGPITPIAAWYERKTLDLHGESTTGGKRLPPLLVHSVSPSLGITGDDGSAHHRIRPSVVGEGVFQIPLGPVRSGVFESIEYVVETPGEEILHVEAKPFYKHRNVDLGFSGRSIEDGVLVAERVEGISSVAHAIAYCQAIEDLSGSAIPLHSQLIRIIHAELERIANHLESIIRLCEASSQAVAYSRLSFHKEEIMRIRSDLSGHRFSRGVVTPGGVRRPLLRQPAVVAEGLAGLERQIDRDLKMLMRTPSFLDRLRATGIVTQEQAREFGALGPVGRGSGMVEDTRLSHRYGGYELLRFLPTETQLHGDVLSRQYVRIDEISNSFNLIMQALHHLNEIEEPEEWCIDLNPRDGLSLGWAESPQGEVLYLVAVEDGRIAAATQRSASFHNLAVFSAAFPKDITTDFAFIEASFGLSAAGISS